MRKRRLYDDLFRLCIVIISATIYSLSILWFLEPAQLLSVGITGVSQILNRAFAMANIHIPIGVFTLIFNIPLFIYGFKTVSPRFVVFSGVSILVQSFWLMGWDWLNVDFGIDIQNNKFFMGTISGLFCGFGIGLALRYGTSTGGMDIISQAFALKKNISIGVFQMIFSVLIAIIGGVMQKSWNTTLYTFIYIIISNLVVDKIHTAYNYLRIDIISNHAEEVAQALLDGIQRGCTIANVKGAYTKEEKYDVFMIISSYELNKAAEIIKATDPSAFMTVSPIKRIFGKFFKHTII